jgi:STE24 endopeptidase
LAHKHILKRLGLSVFTTMIGFTFLGWWALRPDLVIDLGLSPSYGPTLLTGVWILSLITFPLSPISNWWSRKHEFQADQYAVHETSAQDLGQALLELYRKNAGSLVVDKTYAAWNYSHPPLTERLAAMGYSGESSND